MSGTAIGVDTVAPEEIRRRERRSGLECHVASISSATATAGITYIGTCSTTAYVSAIGTRVFGAGDVSSAFASGPASTSAP